MARIVLATFGSLGDLHPVIAVALALQRRGHQAEIATMECYRAKLSALQIPFHPLRPNISLTDDATVRRVMNGARGAEFLLRGLMMPAVRDMHADLGTATKGADLLVASELVYAAPVLADQGGVPWVSYALAPLSYLSAYDPPVPPVHLAGTWLRAMPPWAIRWLNAAAGVVTRSWWRPIRDLRRELGLPMQGNPLFEAKYSSRLDLAMFSRQLQPPQPDWPVSTVQTGFVYYDEDTADLPPPVAEFLSRGDPPIVFTLGSSAVNAADDFYAESASAAKKIGRRALLLLGKNAPPANLPDSILAWNYLPYATIFPHAVAIVHQGGVGTTAQAMRAGKPMLVMPFSFDQPDNGARVTRLGIGETISRSRYTADRAAKKLSVLLADQRYGENARRIATELRNEHGADATCDALERVLR